MKSNKEIEELLKTALKEDIDELESIRKKFISKANKLKGYLLLLLLGFLAKFYFENYDPNAGLEIDLGFGIFTVCVLVGYIFLKPESLVSGKNNKEFYKKVKSNFFPKVINLIDSNIEYLPLYKTHISHISKSGFWNGRYTITKENDGLRFNFSDMKACLSELQIYRSTKKIFSGSFIHVNYSCKDTINPADLSEYISTVRKEIENNFQVEIKESSIDNCFFYAINFKKELMEIKISSKHKVTFDFIKDDLLILYNLISFINMIGSYSVVKMKSSHQLA